MVQQGAPLIVKGKVFGGISGGEGLRARTEQSEPLSGSANAMLCLAGRLSQSFNRAQVIHKTCVTGTLVFLILQAQERRRVNGDQDSQSVCEIEDCAAIALNRDRSSRQTLRRGYSEGDDEPWAYDLDLVKQPLSAYLNFAGVRAFVQPSLAARLELEMLDGVGHINTPAIDPRLRERPVQ